MTRDQVASGPQETVVVRVANPGDEAAQLAGKTFREGRPEWQGHEVAFTEAFVADQPVWITLRAPSVSDDALQAALDILHGTTGLVPRVTRYVAG